MRTSILQNAVATLVLCLAAESRTIGLAQESRKTEAPIPPGSAPPSPEDALGAFRIDPGLKVELVASEPQIESPVAMAFGEDGTLFVVEMRDYPNGPAPGKPPEGRIKRLSDQDGDGRFETATVFADGLLFANGLLPWKDGLIVTAAPAIWFLRDADGDGKAESREILYEGFAALNPQLRVSHPNLGVDGWITVANGLRGGKVVRAGKPGAAAIDIGGMDFRFDPIGDREEAVTGLGQFGLTFDDWGNRFVCDNRHHLRHVVFPVSALKRNPNLAASELVEDVSRLEDGPLNSGAKLYPLSKNFTTSSLHTGRFTAACGVFIYRGALLPESYRGAAFTCDPTGNLVHQEILRPEGATFRSGPPRKGVEFLASPNDGFRPVFLTHGPEGAMYLVDMARKVIEHPEFMPVELKNRPDLVEGKNLGRIWRIVPEGVAVSRTFPKLSGASTNELVALLGHPGPWQRSTAQRLLLQRRDPSSKGPLAQAISGSSNALARLHAAWLLESFDALSDDLLLRLLDANEPGLIQQAVLLSERRLSRSAAVRRKVLDLAIHGDARVRFQVALALGATDDPHAKLRALALIGGHDYADKWTRLAVLSSGSDVVNDLLHVFFVDRDVAAHEPARTNRLTFVRELSAVLGSRRDEKEIAGAISTVFQTTAPALQAAVLEGLSEGLARRGGRLNRLLAELRAKSPELSPAFKVLDGLFKSAASDSANVSSPADRRVSAIRLLASAPWETSRESLITSRAAEADQRVRGEAIKAIASYSEPAAAEALLSGWKLDTPSARKEVQLAMSRRPDRIELLLKEVEAGRIARTDLDPLIVRQLTNQPDVKLRDRARALLGTGVNEERQAVLARYRPASSTSGDRGRGRSVFQKNCASCHRVADLGIDVGPDIADTRVKTKEALLNDILNPNGAIDGNYVNYIVQLKDGTSKSGIVAAESPVSLTLKQAEGKTEVLLREDVEELRSSGLSLMPEGLEKSITEQEMADLLDFLKNWRYRE